MISSFVLSGCQEEVTEEVVRVVPAVPHTNGPTTPPSVVGPSGPPPTVSDNIEPPEAVTETDAVRFVLPSGDSSEL
ncbi:hypothetical protein ACFL2V_06405 [Pseudomonadota bacterium]